MTQTKIKQSSSKRKAIVLSGGSIRGAFQAGALNAILKSGYKPDVIQGISAGALNGIFLASEISRLEGESRWEQAGYNLQKLWKDRIQGPKDILIKKSFLRIGIEILLKDFRGLIKTKPIERLLKKTISTQSLKNCPIDLLVGAVNMLTGAIEYRTQLDEDILGFVLASASMPVIFPPVHLDSKLYYDGGIRDNAPLRHVIKEGVDEIILILTQPNTMEKLELGRSLKPGKISHLIDRTVNILLNDVLVDDLKELQKINQDLNALKACLTVSPNTSLHNKRVIQFKVIRPQRHYKAKIDKFDQVDIHQMLMDGYSQGVKAMHRPFETGIRLQV